MKKLLLLAVAFLMVTATVLYGKKNERKESFKSWENYEIYTLKVGTPGTKYVKVWAYGKKEDDAIMQAKKNAVHACIFRGLPANTGEGANATPALVRDNSVWENNLDYFEKFFAPGGDWLAYINVTSDGGKPSGPDKLKVKGGYKIALRVQVMYDNLKKKLEDDGIIRSLNSGF